MEETVVDKKLESSYERPVNLWLENDVERKFSGWRDGTVVHQEDSSLTTCYLRVSSTIY